MASTPVLRVVEHQFVEYRHTWRGTLTSSFLAPVLYLAAMGLGLGSLVENAAALPGDSYLAFIGPGLLAASAMQIASTESTFPIMGGIKWRRVFHGMLATPIAVPDLVIGRLAWVAVRLTVAATAFFVVITAFGIPASRLAPLGVPAAVLTGLAFASPIMAFSATQEGDQSLVLLLRLGIVPLFLFSGTFFPVDRLPDAMEPLAWFTPLWHGVELVRGLVLGGLGPFAAAGHVAVLVALVAIGIPLSVRAFAHRLAK